MRWSDIPFNPPTKTLRRFGAAGLLILSALAGWQWFQDRPIAAGCLGGLALLFAAVGLTCPAALRPVFVGLMVLGFPLNWVMSRLVLAVVFYCLFTPVALMLQIGRPRRDGTALRSEPGQLLGGQTPRGRHS